MTIYLSTEGTIGTNGEVIPETTEANQGLDSVTSGDTGYNSSLASPIPPTRTSATHNNSTHTWMVQRKWFARLEGDVDLLFDSTLEQACFWHHHLRNQPIKKHVSRLEVGPPIGFDILAITYRAKPSILAVLERLSQLIEVAPAPFEYKIVRDAGIVDRVLHFKQLLVTDSLDEDSLSDYLRAFSKAHKLISRFHPPRGVCHPARRRKHARKWTSGMESLFKLMSPNPKEAKLALSRQTPSDMDGWLAIPANQNMSGRITCAYIPGNSLWMAALQVCRRTEASSENLKYYAVRRNDTKLPISPFEHQQNSITDATQQACQAYDHLLVQTSPKNSAEALLESTIRTKIMIARQTVTEPFPAPATVSYNKQSLCAALEQYKSNRLKLGHPLTSTEQDLIQATNVVVVNMDDILNIYLDDSDS